MSDIYPIHTLSYHVEFSTKEEVVWIDCMPIDFWCSAKKMYTKPRE